MSLTAARSHIPQSTEYLILGSGFGGSLMAIILARAGRSVVLVDRARHPRFAIGESSTPLADQKLRQLAVQFGIPELLPLCSWGSWKRSYPDLMCGRKRGFSYFDLTTPTEHSSDNFASRRLLVAASGSNEHADTHWLRSDVDQFLYTLAAQSGAACLEGCTTHLHLEPATSGWQAECHTDQQSHSMNARFVIDATGSAGAVLSALGVADHTSRLRTNSHSVFAHFGDTRSCEELFQTAGLDVTRFPFQCDDAAVHQVLPSGWMWQLRFDDQSLSAGFMIDAHEERSEHCQLATAAEEWSRLLATHPFLETQFADASVIRPASGLHKTGRIQRLSAAAAGASWAALPSTVGFIDPLHSSGIAHTLFGIERLANLLLHESDPRMRSRGLTDYSDLLIRELHCVDELVEGCYAGLPSFALWCDWSMLYFAASTSMEQSSDASSNPGFLCAADPGFREFLTEARQRLGTVRRSLEGAHSDQSTDEFREWLRAAITPWNHVGLFDDRCDNLYATTAAPVTASEAEPQAAAD